MINTNLPPILHCFQVTVKFSLAREECLTLKLSLRVIPANIAVGDITKNWILWPTFLLQKVSVYFQPLLRNLSRKLPNSVKVRRGYRYYAVQGHSRSPITVCAVVQNCCKGRSKKYRKWHFSGCCRRETLNRLIQNLAWVITSGTLLSIPNGISICLGAWPPRRDEMLMVCAFLSVL